MNKQRRSFADFQDTGWRTGLFRALLIVAVASSVLSAPLAILRMVAPWPFAYVLPLAALAATLGLFNTVRLGRPNWRKNRTSLFRLGEICLLIIAVRIVTWAVSGWPAAAQLAAWLRHPAAFADGEFIVVSILVLIPWNLAISMTGDFLDLAIQPDEVAAREMHDWGDSRRQWLVFRPVARSEIVGRFAQRWVWAGTALVIMAALSRVVMTTDSRGLVRVGLSSLGLPGDVLAGLLVYFLAGLVLVSDARLALLRGHWYNEQLDTAASVTRQWRLIGVIVVGGVALLALARPYGSTNWLAIALEWVIALVMRGLLILLALLQLLAQLVDYLLQLLFGREAPSQAHAPVAPPLPSIPTQAEMTRRLPDWLTGGAVWVVVLLAAGYLLYTYLHANGKLSFAGFGQAAWWIKLRFWWGARRAQLTRLVQESAERRARRARTRMARPGGAHPRRLADLLPREQVRRLYLLALEQAAQAGLLRPPAKTPLEFVRDLEAAWPDAQPDLQALTEAFVAARYAARDIAPGEVQQVQGVWQRIMAHLRRPGGSEPGSRRGG